MATVSTKTAVVCWHELIAPDVEPAKAFYTSLLGWTMSVWKPGAADYSMIHLGGRDHGGFFARERAAPHWLVYVEVADVDAVVAKVPGLGGTVFVEPEEIEDVGRYAVIADAQGAVLAVITPTEPAMPPPEGVFSWDELATTDVDAAKGFYGELLGWTATEFMPDYSVFRAADADVAGLMRKPAQAPAPAWLTYLKVDDTDAIIRRGLELGATVAMEPLQVEGVGRYAVLVDPVGAAFGLVGPER